MAETKHEAMGAVQGMPGRGFGSTLDPDWRCGKEDWASALDMDFGVKFTITGSRDNRCIIWAP